MFRRAFALAGGLRVHYRRAGAGAPVVLLHPSPLSSLAVLPVATAISRSHQVFALDTPGYGLSEPLPRRPASLDDYLAPLGATMDSLGIGRCCLYGAATGAQIALEFAVRYPERVALLVMDTAGHIGAAECERLVAGYFPDVAPRADGGHLLTLWGLVRDLGVFFPWNDTRRASRIARDLPSPGFMQAMLLDYLRAGVRYDWAYRPAFYNERIDRLRHCRVPAILTRWPSSIALAITDALIAQGLPGNFRVLDLGPSLAERAAGIAAAIAAAWSGPPSGPNAASAASHGAFASEFLDADALQLHARVCSAGQGRPLVALHRAGAAARLMEPMLMAVAGSRPLVAIDLPGQGESDPAEDGDALSGTVAAAIDSLGLTEADLLGDGLGAQVAARLAMTRPARFPRLAAISRRQSADGAAPWPALSPRLDGSHLLESWFMLRDRRLWSPWHQRTAANIIDHREPDLEPPMLHEELVELLKCGERFATLAAAEAGWDLEPQIARLDTEVLLLEGASDCAAGVSRWLYEGSGGKP